MSSGNEVHVDNEKGGIKKPFKRRTKPGQKALREIRFYQLSDRTLIPVAIMQRAVRHILTKLQPGGARIQAKAFKQLHVGVEEHITRMFKGAQIMSIHAGRQTVMPRDLHSLTRVCDTMEGANDLDIDPINERMSEKHKKKCASRRRYQAKRKDKPVATKKPVQAKDQEVEVVETEVVVEERIEIRQVEEEVMIEEESSLAPILENVFQEEDDWLLGE